MDKKGLYTSQLGAGLGLVEETRALIEIWFPGMEGLLSIKRRYTPDAFRTCQLGG
jgi:hypothetical protein